MGKNFSNPLGITLLLIKLASPCTKLEIKIELHQCLGSWYGKSITFKKKKIFLTICRQSPRLQIHKKCKQQLKNFTPIKHFVLTPITRLGLCLKDFLTVSKFSTRMMTSGINNGLSKTVVVNIFVFYIWAKIEKSAV